MMEDDEHRRCVNAWLARVANGKPVTELIDAFEVAFSALWQRAHVTLGEVTLAAIVTRVLHSAAEAFPFVSPIELHATGINCDALRESVADRPADQVAEALGFALVELITVVGNLTADILTPALHAELSGERP